MQSIPVIQEYFENQAQHVEEEQVGSRSSDQPKPWDPEAIRIQTKPFSLRQVLDMIRDQDIDLAPDFQRFSVWKPPQKSRLIESILLGIPLPSFYFSEDKQGKMQVVDGLQRLTAISLFGNDEFPLRELEYLKELEGLTFSGLEPVFRRRLNTTQIFVNVIDPQTPWKVKFDVFKRINTGGSPLNAQEIRHCMSGPMARQFLKQMTSSEFFHRATDYALREHLRMADKEVALRFCAFRLDENKYRDADSFDSFLGATVELLESCPESLRSQLLEEFERAMELSFQLFGDRAFRKWDQTESARNPINKALFEAWSVALVEVDPQRVLSVRDAIVKKAREAMTLNQEFITSISQGTGDVSKVETRFRVVREILREALATQC